MPKSVNPSFMLNRSRDDPDSPVSTRVVVALPAPSGVGLSAETAVIERAPPSPMKRKPASPWSTLTLADGESDRWGFGFHAGSIVPGPEVLSRTSGALVSPEAVVTDPPAKRLVPLTAITVTEPLTKSGCQLGSVTPVPKVLTRAK